MKLFSKILNKTFITANALVLALFVSSANAQVSVPADVVASIEAAIQTGDKDIIDQVVKKAVADNPGAAEQIAKIAISANSNFTDVVITIISDSFSGDVSKEIVENIAKSYDSEGSKGLADQVRQISKSKGISQDTPNTDGEGSSSDGDSGADSSATGKGGDTGASSGDSGAVGVTEVPSQDDPTLDDGKEEGNASPN